jgi:hypothetical protein
MIPGRTLNLEFPHLALWFWFISSLLFTCRGRADTFSS